MSATPALADRVCRTCGQPVADSGPCPACALEQALLGGGEPAALTAAPASTLPDFGPWVLEAEIGVGGMGIVYAAHRREDGLPAAVKVLVGGPFADADARARFAVEARAVARLEHPNLVRLHDAGEHAGQLFLALERLPGHSLADRLRGGNPLPAREAAALVAAVAGAVQHAHERGVLHRDITPGNILLDADGNPRLGDFGLAKLAETGGAGLTRSAALLGTPPYMAPEQVAGRVRDVSTATDVWALGAVLYHALSGHAPFPGRSAAETWRAILDAEPAALRRSAVVHRDLETICRRCLEKNPARRPRSAGVLAEELTRWLAGKPIRLRTYTTRERVWRSVRRHPVRAAGIAALGLSLLAGVTASTLLWLRAEAARDRAEDNAFFAGIAGALSARERSDFSLARRTLAALDPRRRGPAWGLVAGLCRGDETRCVRFDTARPETCAWCPVRGRLGVLDANRRLHWLDPATGTTEPGPLLPDPRAALGDAPIDRGFHTLTFSPDGEVLAAADGDVLVVADARTGALLHAAVARRVQPLWLDRDRLLYGGNIAAAAEPRENSSVFDRRTGRATALPRGRLAPFALTADGRRLASIRALGGDRWVLEIRDPGTLENPDATPPLASWPATEETLHLAFSADAAHLGIVTADRDAAARVVRVVDAADGRERFQQALPRCVHAMAFHPREPLLLVATDDPAARWFRYLQPPTAPAVYDDGSASSLAQPVGPGGPADPPTGLLTRSAQNGRAGFLLGHEERISAAAFLPGDGVPVTLSADGTVRFWPAPDAAHPPAARNRTAPVQTWYAWEHPAASADGQRLLYLESEGQAVLWHRADGKRRRLPPDEFPLAVLRDGAPVTRRSADGRITVWEPRPPSAGAADGGEGDFRPRWSVAGVPSHPGFGQAIRGVLSRDETRLAALIPGKVLLVDLVARTAVGTGDQRMVYGPSSVNGLDLSPDGGTLAVTGLLGRRVRLYRAADLSTPGPPFVRLGAEDNAPDYDTTVAFHPDGRRLLVGREDGSVRVFDLGTGLERTAEGWRAQSSAVTALAVSADGRIVATSGDRTLRLWDTDLGRGRGAAAGGQHRERLRLGIPAARNWLRFTGNDATLLHAAPECPLEAWEIVSE